MWRRLFGRKKEPSDTSASKVFTWGTKVKTACLWSGCNDEATCGDYCTTHYYVSGENLTYRAMAHPIFLALILWPTKEEKWMWKALDIKTLGDEKPRTVAVGVWRGAETPVRAMKLAVGLFGRRIQTIGFPQSAGESARAFASEFLGKPARVEKDKEPAAVD